MVSTTLVVFFFSLRPIRPYKGSMKTRVFLVRHGATVLSAEDRFAGATNVELSEVGRQQATALAQRLA